MEGHQRNLYLYDRFNARVAGVSRDPVDILKYWAEDLGLTFPLFSNPGGHLGLWFGTLKPGAPLFSRHTLIIDRKGTIRYAKKGSPDYREILLFLKKLQQEEEGTP